MSKYDEVFGTRSRQKLYDEVFGKYTPPQEEPEKDSGLFDTAGNAFDWWKNNSLAGAGFLGGLASETAGNILQNLGLESAGNLAQNAADTMLDFGAKKVYTADGDNFSGSFANQLMSGLTGSFGRLASMIHSDKTADTMINSSESLANKTPVSTDNLAEYFTNPRGFVSDAGQLAGSMAAIVPFMGLVPEAAAARGVAALGGDAITQALINRGLYGAAKVFAGGAPRAAQYALTSAPVEGAMEGGETRRELLNQGASEEEATKESLITMGKNIPLLLATNTLEGLAFFSPLKGANKALQIGGRAAANSAQQQYEEFAQEGIQNAALGKPAGWLPWNGTPEQYEAAERVRYPALLMGGIGGTAQALSRNENQENFERGSQENISNEDYSARANKAGQNLWTWASNISGGQMSDGVFNSIVRNAQELGVDPKLALALATAESNGNQDDISPVGAIGVMQLMPETAEGLGVDPYDQEQNIRGGLTYLKQQLDRFNGDWKLAAAAYNAGAGAVEKYGGIPPYAETENYVARINGFLGESPEYQGGEESLGNEEITYLGENGKGEGKYWVRNPNMNVSTEGMRPESLNALDILGKYYFDHTGKPLILNAGTNGDHAAGEFSHANGWKFDIIDQLEGDGALITANYGRGEFLNQFVKYGRSLGLGMNFEGEGTSNVHLDVAVDGTQWDGNGDHAGGFNLDRVRATAPKKSRSKQSPQSQTQRTNQEETSKPLFDINAEDSTTQKLLEQFAKERFSKAVDDEDAEPVNFFNGMFDDKDNFQNTPENRNAIIERYGDEFKTWAANQNQNQQEQPQPAKTNSPVKQTDDPYKRRAEIKNTANKFLEQLRATGDPNKASVVFGLQNALTGGNFAEAENILKQNGIAVPAIDFKSLQNGSSKKIQEWQAKLSQAGAFAISSPQTQRQVTATAINEPVESKTAGGTTVFTPQSVIRAEEQKRNSLKYRAQQILNKAAAQHTQNVLREREVDLSNDEAGGEAPFDYSNYVNDDKPTTPGELQRQENEKIIQKYQAQQEKRRQERAAFDAAVKKDKENNYGLRADIARQRREQFLATRVDPITARGNAISDMREDEEFLREEDRKENEEASQVSADTIRKNYQNAQRKVQKLKDDVENPVTDREYFQKLSEWETREDEEIKEALRREEDQQEAREAGKQSPEQIRENYALAQRLGDFDTNERLENMRKEGRKQLDLEIERLKTAEIDARKAAGKEVIRTLRNPKYNEVKTKVEATSGLRTALEHGSVEAIRQVRNLIAEVDNRELQARQVEEKRELQARQAKENRLREEARRKREAENSARSLIDIFEDDDFEDNLQREIADEDVQAGIRPRVQSVRTAQADEATRQVQEEYKRRYSAQSRQASELAQQELAQATAQNLQTRQQAPQPQPAAVDNVETEVEEASPKPQAQPSPEEALRRAGITKPTRKGRWTVTTGRPDDSSSLRDFGKFFVLIGDNMTDADGFPLRGEAYGRRSKSNPKLFEKISGNVDKMLESYGGKRFNLNGTLQDDIFAFDDQESAKNFSRALNIYFGNEEFTKAPTTPKRSKKAAALHAKFKTDTHPLIGEYLDNLLERAKSKNNTADRSLALSELKRYEERDVTDEFLNKAEEGLKKEQQRREEWEKQAEIKREKERQERQRRREHGRFINEDETDVKKIEAAYKAKMNELFPFSKYPEMEAFAAKKIAWLKSPLTGFRTENFINDLAENISYWREEEEDGRLGHAIHYAAEEVLRNSKDNFWDKAYGYAKDVSWTKDADRKLGELSFTHADMSSEEVYNRVHEILYGKETSSSEQPVPKPKIQETQTAPPETVESTQEKPNVEEVAQPEQTQNLNDEFFEKFEGLSISDDTPYFGAGLKASAFPLGDEDYLSDKAKQTFEKIAEQHGGKTYGAKSGRLIEARFKTAKARDNFIRAAMDDGFYSMEHGRQKVKLTEREQKSQAEAQAKAQDEAERAKRQAEIEPIINDAKEEAYKILEADKYPEVKDWFAPQVEKGLKSKNISTVEGARDYAQTIIKTVKSFRDGKQYPRGVLGQIIQTWYDSKLTGKHGTFPEKYKAKYETAKKIIDQAVEGEISLDEAYPKLKSFLKSGRLKETQPEQTAQPKRKSKGKWHTIGSAGSREDLQKSMQSHGMTVEITPDGKIITSNGKTLSDKIRVVKGRWQYGYYESEPTKFSKQGEVDTRIENFVDDKDLTPQQKLIKSFGEKLDTQVVFFRGDENFYGVRKNGATYMNVNSNKPLGKVFWHESLHWLKHNNPKLYQQLVKAADITDEQRDAYLEQTERNDLYTDAAIDEEIIADQMEDVAKRTGLLQSIAGKNRGLIQRVVQWLKDTMNKFIAHFRNPDGKLTTNQSIALADEFGRIAKDLVDPNGQKIFRYNRRTHDIELADGRSLNSVQNDEDTRYSFAGRKAKTADKESLKRAKQMEKRGANRDEIYNATGWFKGKDNKWRFEIPDNFDRIDFDKLWWNEDTQYRLDEIYDNPALFAAYPELRKVLVSASNSLPANVQGETNGNEITLNWSKIDTEREDAGKTLVHEIQHVIQDYEDFASGGNNRNVLSRLKDNMTKINKAIAQIPNAKKYFKAWLDVKNAMATGDEETLIEALKVINSSIKNISAKDRQKIMDYADRFYELRDTVDGIRAAKGEFVPNYTEDENGNEIEEEIPLQPVLKLEAYDRLGGEQEARAVEERLFNKNGTPKPHGSDALIIFSGKTYALSKEPSQNKKNAFGNGDGELVKDGDRRGRTSPSAVTADGTTDYWSPTSLQLLDNKGGVKRSATVDTNSPNGSISQGEEPVKYSLGGKKAKTADKSLLRRAMEMERRGASRDQIFQTTGWVKGKDNLWRFEIPDDLTKINFGKLKRDGKATLGEIYHNPKLFAAYPQLKNMRIAISVLPKINGKLQVGDFWPSKNIITLNKEVADVRPDRAKKALVHEIQHAIQKIEGFTFGGDESSNSDYKNLGGEQEAREVAARADMSEEKRRATTPTIHDENAIITSADKKRTTDTTENETSTDENNDSIGNNDNSSESLTRKIKNKLSAYLDGKRPTERRKKRITENLRALSGHRILYGNVKGADDIVVDHMQKLIQSRHTYDWEKLLPVVGKEIAKQLKLNPTSEQSNYIADWLLTGALNNTSAEAKNFQKAMRENPAQAELLQQTRDIFQEISDMSPWERVGSSLVERKGKTFLEKLGIGEGSFEEQFVNDLAGLTKLVDDAAKNSTPEVAEMIRRGCSPDKLAQLSRGKGAVAELMVKGKTADIENIRAALSEIYPAIDFSRFKPLEAIFESVGGDVKGLEIFAVAKLTKEICEYNRANPDDKITPYISEADADHIISTGEKKFGQAQKDLVNFSNRLLGMQYDSGLLTDNQFFRILKKWKNYIPMARVFDENENYDKLDFLKKRKGHENDTWSPIQTMIANANKVVQACEQNKVKLEIANLVRFGGFDSNLSEVTSSNPDVGNIIRFKENGKTKYLETPDPAIKRAVDALQSQSEGSWLVKMLRAATSFMRIRYTGGNVDFAAGNLARDLPDAYVHNQHLGLTTPITELIDAWRIGFKGAWRAFTGKPLTKEFIEWQIHGGAQAAFVSGDVDYIQRSINDATTTRAQRYRQRPFTQLLDDFQKISEFTENITRLSTYTLAKKKLAKRNGGVATLSDKQLAAHASREASIDFAKAGISTRKINNYILFANAAVQGLAQWGYAVREAKRGNSKPLFGKVFRAMTHAVCLAMLQFALAHGDDERKKEYEQAPAWEKETYWILGGVRIPKGMDVGIRLMANFTDEALGALFDKKSFDAKRLFDTARNALPSITATVITPALEVKMNHSIFRDAPIVPRSKENLNPEHQFDTNTSSVAKLFGQMTGWSPLKIDYLIQGYLGTMGRFAAHVPNYVERGGIGLDEMPMIRRFVFEPYKNPQIVKDYYEAYDEQFSHYNTYKLTREKPDGFDPALYKRLQAAQEPMRKISKLEKKILDDPKLTYDERKAKIRELEKRRIALCEKVFK